MNPKIAALEAAEQAAANALREASRAYLEAPYYADAPDQITRDEYLTLVQAYKAASEVWNEAVNALAAALAEEAADPTLTEAAAALIAATPTNEQQPDADDTPPIDEQPDADDWIMDDEDEDDCPSCGGDGMKDEFTPCPKCEGYGWLSYADDDDDQPDDTTPTDEQPNTDPRPISCFYCKGDCYPVYDGWECQQCHHFYHHPFYDSDDYDNDDQPDDDDTTPIDEQQPDADDLRDYPDQPLTDARLIPNLPGQYDDIEPDVQQAIADLFVNKMIVFLPTSSPGEMRIKPRGGAAPTEVLP